jgi:aspartate racemase
MRKKTAGIIGGIGPESTIEYYRFIIDGYREQRGDGSYPSMIINSIDLKTLADAVLSNQLDQAADYLVNSIQKLEKAGVDFAVIAANTPHIVFDEVRKRTSLPLISIVEATCEVAGKLNLKIVALFGTRPTMQGRFYSDVFSRAGITLAVPPAEDQTYIHDKYMNELVHGVVLPETRARLLEIIDQMKERAAIEAVVLGGTELSLILPDAEHKGLPFLNTARIHAAAIVAKLLS